MEEKEVLTVQELENLKKKSIQGIYKRIKNPNDVIQNFLKRDNDGHIVEPYMIFTKGIDIIYPKDKNKNNTSKLNNNPSLAVEFNKEGKQQEKTAYTKTIEILQEQLNLLQEELKAERADKQQKDKLIFELNERLAESQRNLDQQQKLQLFDRKRIQELEEGNTRPLHKKLLSLFSRRGATANEWGTEKNNWICCKFF